MSKIDADNLRQKLADLKSSSDSIQGVSKYIQLYRADADRIAEIWVDEFYKKESSGMVYMVYLANDVIQNTIKKKDSRFPAVFLRGLLKVLPFARRSLEDDTDGRWERISRVVKILDERQTMRPYADLHRKILAGRLGRPPGGPVDWIMQPLGK